MVLELFSLVAVVLSLISIILLFKVMQKLGTGKLRTGYNLIALGIFLSVTIHSISEMFETYKVIELELLRVIMPLLVSIGSIFFIIAGITIIKALDGK